MRAVAQIDTLSEGGFIARLHPNADLDQTMLEIAEWWYIEGMGRGDGWWPEDDDNPTFVPTWRTGGEVELGWFRKVPCNCGDEHAWDLHDSRPGPGAFLGVASW